MTVGVAPRDRGLKAVAERLRGCSLTIVLQMLAKLGIAMASCRDVKVAHHLVDVDTSIDATAICVAPELRRLPPLCPLPARRYDIVYMLLPKALVAACQVLPAGTGVDSPLAVSAEPVDAPAVDPLAPSGRVVLQAQSGENAVARGVLHVHMEVTALHSHHDVEVDL